MVNPKSLREYLTCMNMGRLLRVLDVRNILLFADLIHILYEDNLNSLTVYASVPEMDFNYRYIIMQYYHIV